MAFKQSSAQRSAAPAPVDDGFMDDPVFNAGSKIIDFAKLRQLTPADTANMDAERLMAVASADRARRESLVKKHVEIVLETDIEVRSTRLGQQIGQLRGREDRRDTAITAVHWAPAHLEHYFDALAHKLVAGARVRLGGYWKKRGWRDQAGDLHETWEFQAQTIAVVR